MRVAILSRVIFILVITCIALSLQNVPKQRTKTYDKRFIKYSGYNNIRYKPIRTTTSKPGFFRTLFSVAFEQWADTKNTTNQISQAIDNNFLPENAPITPSTTSAPNVSTTTAVYKIKRSELLKIIRRNLNGINRLYNLELQDAKKQSAKTYAEFRKNLTNEISKFL